MVARVRTFKWSRTCSRKWFSTFPTRIAFEKWMCFGNAAIDFLSFRYGLFRDGQRASLDSGTVPSRTLVYFHPSQISGHILGAFYTRNILARFAGPIYFAKQFKFNGTFSTNLEILKQRNKSFWPIRLFAFIFVRSFVQTKTSQSHSMAELTIQIMSY